MSSPRDNNRLTLLQTFAHWIAPKSIYSRPPGVARRIRGFRLISVTHELVPTRLGHRLGFPHIRGSYEGAARCWNNIETGAIRFAQGPGETLGDRVSTHRGMSIKVFGVEGERLPGHDAPVQDFVLATGTTFPSGTAKGFLRDGTLIGGSAGMPEGVKSAVSSTMRNLNKALHAFGTASAKADFFGHPFSHPLSDSYFSQAPIRFGDYVAKLGAVPAAPDQLALADWRLDPHQDEDGFHFVSVTQNHPDPKPSGAAFVTI